MNLVAAGAHTGLPPAPSAGAGEAIRLTHLTKRFAVRRSWRSTLVHPRRREWTTALDDVTCTVGEGEFFGLLGPNGAGKTTLFKVLATLVLPDRGSAAVGGFDVVHQPGQVRQVLAPVITDDRSLYWRLTAGENLELYARLHDLPKSRVAQRVGELLEVVGLGDAGPKMVGAFSSGMKQRLLIARALIARPRILLLDEPTRSLDPLSARTFRSFLREEISGRQRCTVLLATHNTEEALELCDRVAVLHRGRLLAVGVAAELSRRGGSDRYRLWTRSPVPGSLAALQREGVVDGIETLPDSDGWSRVEMDVAGGLEGAARVTDGLGRAGAAIGRFELIQRSLADLIEGIIASRPSPSDG